MRELPVFEAVINEEEDGIFCVSLVDKPATQTEFVLFAEQEKTIKFSVDNEDKHLITSVVMVADTPIYRRDASGKEYYIVYHKETLRQMAEKMLADGTHNNFDIMHDGEILPKGVINIVELYIVDKEKGISPNFINIPDGSLMATYKVNDENIWQKCKDGTFGGISLAGYFSIKDENINNNKNNITSKFMEIIEKLKTLIVEAETEVPETDVIDSSDSSDSSDNDAETVVEAEEVVAEEVAEEVLDSSDSSDNDDAEAGTDLSDVYTKIDEIIASVSDLEGRISAVEENLKETVEVPIEEKTGIEEVEENKFSRIAKLINKN